MCKHTQAFLWYSPCGEKAEGNYLNVNEDATHICSHACDSYTNQQSYCHRNTSFLSRSSHSEQLLHSGSQQLRGKENSGGTIEVCSGSVGALSFGFKKNQFQHFCQESYELNSLFSSPYSNRHNLKDKKRPSTVFSRGPGEKENSVKYPNILYSNNTTETNCYQLLFIKHVFQCLSIVFNFFGCLIQ